PGSSGREKRDITDFSERKGYGSGTHFKEPPGWQNFPTQSPVRLGNDGLSRKLERYINHEIYETISKTSQENRIQNLPEVWARVQQEEVWNEIRRFYALESKEVLLQTMQLY